MDDNDKSVTYGVSHIDGVTPVAISFVPSTRHMLIDLLTTIEFNPAQGAAARYAQKLAKATSDASDGKIRPWVVNATTGAVLASKT